MFKIRTHLSDNDYVSWLKLFLIKIFSFFKNIYKFLFKKILLIANFNFDILKFDVFLACHKNSITNTKNDISRPRKTTKNITFKLLKLNSCVLESSSMLQFAFELHHLS